jgi:transcriptional regulator with XRE-family HTH domain
VVTVGRRTCTIHAGFGGRAADPPAFDPGQGLAAPPRREIGIGDSYSELYLLGVIAPCFSGARSVPSMILVEAAADDLERQRRLLSTILKTIRGLRRLSARGVADAMGLKLRTYYDFEAGQGVLDIARIWRFATATDSDPVAIVEALMLGAPEHAVRCMDNKAASIMLGSFRQFSDRVGDRMIHIGSAAVIEAFKRPFEGLEEHLERRDVSAERWLERHSPRIDRPSD